jgi:hypothetical protein
VPGRGPRAAGGERFHVEFERVPSSDLLEEIRCRKPEVIAALSDARALGEISWVAPLAATEPVVLRDGRVMHRFRAAGILRSRSPDTAALLDRLPRAGVVLVADGMELHVVGRWKGQLHPQTLRTLQDNAAAAIAVLRGEHRARVGQLPAECAAEYDPKLTDYLETGGPTRRDTRSRPERR